MCSDAWFVLPHGMFNDGTISDGMFNDGTISDGMFFDGIIHDEAFACICDSKIWKTFFRI